MSDMNYKKKYEEAMDRMELCVRSGLKITPEYIFPELAESEDEKIRKEIVRFIQMEVEDEIVGNKWLAWLGKQKGNIWGISANWSEEDEVKINRIVACLKNLNVADNDILLKDVDWLKSLKGRVQPKQEWNEEDEQHIDSLLKRLDALCRNKFERTRFAISEDKDWLKSLKQRIQKGE